MFGLVLLFTHKAGLYISTTQYGLSFVVFRQENPYKAHLLHCTFRGRYLHWTSKWIIQTLTCSFADCYLHWTSKWIIQTLTCSFADCYLHWTRLYQECMGLCACVHIYTQCIQIFLVETLVSTMTHSCNIYDFFWFVSIFP